MNARRLSGLFSSALSRRQLLQWTPAVAASLSLPSVAQTEWPRDKTITFIVPFTAGSGTDVIARTIAEKLAPALGTQIVIDNRTGAGGTVGAALVAKAPSDGYTMLIHSSGHVVNPALYPKLSYDTLKDFDGVSTLASLPNVLVVSPSKGYKDVADLVAKAKAQPGACNYASAGNGSATHMNAEKFRVATGVQAQHVPYRGTPEALTETSTGRIDWFFAPLVSALPLIQSGRLQALAVSTPTRSPLLPNVPSIAEAGFANAAYTFWVGLFVTAKTPKPIVQKLHAALMTVLALPDVKERLEKLGASAMPMQQEAFEKYLDTETLSAAQLVKAAGIRIE
jgi:tripartite-type tricarboxylate transporter receptor subunit TctC